MSRQLVFFLFMFLYAMILSGAMSGEIGLVSAALAGAVDSNDTTVTVDTTSGFPSSGRLWIGDEQLSYSGTSATTFTGLTRGVDTEASSHASSTRVYSEGAGVANQLLGYRVLSTLQSGQNPIFQTFTVATQLPIVLKNIIVKLVQADFAFFDGHGAWLKFIIYYPLAAGLVISTLGFVFGRT